MTVSALKYWFPPWPSMGTRALAVQRATLLHRLFYTAVVGVLCKPLSHVYRQRSENG
jgi:hypothetical protein